MTYQPPRSDHQDDELEYVGAPTEFADVEEAPEWVANIAKVLFFLPSALLTASTIPFMLLGLILTCCACWSMASIALNAM